MKHVIESRGPLTEAEVLGYLQENVDREARHWGEDYIYTKWAKEARDKKLAQFRAGEVVAVWSESFVDSWGNGCGDFEDTLYSDGHVETTCYGYLD